MARAYTAELRDRVLRACERGGLSRASLAALFGVGESTLYRWQQAWRSERQRAAKPHVGGPAPRLDAKALDTLKELVAERNDRTLAEYAQELDKRAGVKASPPTLCRALKKLGLRRKKRACARRSRTAPSFAQARNDWRAELAGAATPSASSSLTRAGSTPGWPGPTPVPLQVSAPWARCRRALEAVDGARCPRPGRRRRRHEHPPPPPRPARPCSWPSSSRC